MWADEFVSACAIGLCQKRGLTHTLPPPFFLHEFLCSVLSSSLLPNPFSDALFSHRIASLNGEFCWEQAV